MTNLYKLYFKRLVDLIAALILLLLTSPVLCIAAAFLCFQNKGRVFFFQERPGRGAVIFKIIKFKTMSDERDKAGNLLPDNKRITRVGRIIRKLSIDELPQLINVLWGHMSIVGPRPLLPKYLTLYSKDQMRRHEVRPGITGWAQVNGRNSISWTDRFRYDIYYVDNLSFLLDAKIFLLTIAKVIKREGINQSDERPMQSFNGYN